MWGAPFVVRDEQQRGNPKESNTLKNWVLSNEAIYEYIIKISLKELS